MKKAIGGRMDKDMLHKWGQGWLYLHQAKETTELKLLGEQEVDYIMLEKQVPKETPTTVNIHVPNINIPVYGHANTDKLKGHAEIQ